MVIININNITMLLVEYIMQFSRSTSITDPVLCICMTNGNTASVIMIIF